MSTVIHFYYFDLEVHSSWYFQAILYAFHSGINYAVFMTYRNLTFGVADRLLRHYGDKSHYYSTCSAESASTRDCRLFSTSLRRRYRYCLLSALSGDGGTVMKCTVPVGVYFWWRRTGCLGGPTSAVHSAADINLRRKSLVAAGVAARPKLFCQLALVSWQCGQCGPMYQCQCGQLACEKWLALQWPDCPGDCCWLGSAGSPLSSLHCVAIVWPLTSLEAVCCGQPWPQLSCLSSYTYCCSCGWLMLTTFLFVCGRPFISVEVHCEKFWHYLSIGWPVGDIHSVVCSGVSSWLTFNISMTNAAIQCSPHWRMASASAWLHHGLAKWRGWNVSGPQPQSMKMALALSIVSMANVATWLNGWRIPRYGMSMTWPFSSNAGSLFYRYWYVTGMTSAFGFSISSDYWRRDWPASLLLPWEASLFWKLRLTWYSCSAFWRRSRPLRLSLFITGYLWSTVPLTLSIGKSDIEQGTLGIWCSGTLEVTPFIGDTFSAIGTFIVVFWPVPMFLFCCLWLMVFYSDTLFICSCFILLCHSGTWCLTFRRLASILLEAIFCYVVMMTVSSGLFPDDILRRYGVTQARARWSGNLECLWARERRWCTMPTFTLSASVCSNQLSMTSNVQWYNEGVGVCVVGEVL